MLLVQRHMCAFKFRLRPILKRSHPVLNMASLLPAKHCLLSAKHCLRRLGSALEYVHATNMFCAPCMQNNLTTGHFNILLPFQHTSHLYPCALSQLGLLDNVLYLMLPLHVFSGARDFLPGSGNFTQSKCLC